MKTSLYAVAPEVLRDGYHRLKRLVGADVHAHVDRVTLRHIARYLKANGFVTGRDVLDVACGSGYGSLVLSSASSYRGVDLDPRALREARHEYPEYEFVECSIYSLPFSDGSIDAVTSFETLEHLDRPKVGMAEIARVLRQGGVFVGSIPINHPDRIHHFRPYSAVEGLNIFTSNEAMRLLHVYVQKEMRFDEVVVEHLSRIVSGTLYIAMEKAST